jgi:hypothetical protein
MYPPRQIVRAVRRNDAGGEAKSSLEAAYHELLQGLTEQYQPADLLERIAVEEIAAAAARLRRTHVFEVRAFELAFGPNALAPALNELDRLMTHSDRLSQRLHRATMNLLEMRQTRGTRGKKKRTEIARAAASHEN